MLIYLRKSDPNQISQHVASQAEGGNLFKQVTPLAVGGRYGSWTVVVGLGHGTVSPGADIVKVRSIGTRVLFIV